MILNWNDPKNDEPHHLTMKIRVFDANDLEIDLPLSFIDTENGHCLWTVMNWSCGSNQIGQSHYSDKFRKVVQAEAYFAAPLRIEAECPQDKEFVQNVLKEIEEKQKKSNIKLGTILAPPTGVSEFASEMNWREDSCNIPFVPVTIKTEYTPKLEEDGCDIPSVVVERRK